jgi:hypothetical protein
VSYEMFGHPAVIARLADRRLELSVSPALCSERWFQPDPNRLTPRSNEPRANLRFGL